MKLRSYFNPTVDSDKMRTVQIRVQGDAAPAAPFVALGNINHEVPDNASGMQMVDVSHAIYNHVQEQLYRQHGIQDMQKIKLTHAGSFNLINRVIVNRGLTRLGIGHESTISVAFDPSNATHDAVKFTVSNPDLVDIVSNTGDGTFTFRNKGKGELFVRVKTTGYEQSFPYEFDEKLAAAIKVASITLAPSTVTLTVAAPTQQLTPTVLPANATNKGVTYTTSNAAVATVSSTGLVTRVGNGSAVITATAKDGSGITGTKNVTATA